MDTVNLYAPSMEWQGAISNTLYPHSVIINFLKFIMILETITHIQSNLIYEYVKELSISNSNFSSSDDLEQNYCI